MEFSQELISIAVLVFVCSISSIICVCIWMCRCRHDNVQASEHMHDREVQLQNFQQEKAKTGQVQATLKPGKIPDVERSAQDLRSHRGSIVHTDSEIIHQYEERPRPIMNNQRPISAAQRLRDEETVRNKRLDTISEMAVSTDSLQRNDSKTNVFNNQETRVGQQIEVDFNPGLNSSINLDKI